MARYKLTTFGQLRVGERYSYIRGGMVFLKVAEGRCRLVAHSQSGEEYEVKGTEVYKVEG